MVKDIIKNFYVLLFAIYSFYKLLNISPKTKFSHYFFVIFSLLTSTFSAFLFTKNFSLNWLCILLSYFFAMFFVTKLTLSTTYITVLFSFSLSFTAFSLCAIITSSILSPFYYNSYEIPWIAIRFFAGIIHFSSIHFCFRIPRLKKGMTFLYNIPVTNIGSSMCLCLFILTLIFSQSKTYSRTFIFSCITIVLFSSLFLIYWWNYHITETYRKFLRKNELDSLNLLLEERNQKILYLKNQNDKLARLIHKDNKIIPAITSAIMESYESKTTLNLTEWETDSPLCLKLKQLYDERVNMLETYHNEIMNLPKTGFDSINATLSFMHSEASKTEIPFQIVLYDNLKTTIPDEITEDDFNHMLSDLLSNAINACKNVSSRSIQIYLGKTEDISIIKICNTGSVFHLETLKNLGLARHTTHADTGGSGIGLMDIWKIKEKYKASLLIDEISDAASSETYTCMNILFNHKNHFIIQSDRYKELVAHINRPDVMIISQN